jgi:hypothetical protein
MGFCRDLWHQAGSPNQPIEELIGLLRLIVDEFEETQRKAVEPSSHLIWKLDVAEPAESRAPLRGAPDERFRPSSRHGPPSERAAAGGLRQRQNGAVDDRFGITTGAA